MGWGEKGNVESRKEAISLVHRRDNGILNTGTSRWTGDTFPG